jgi:tetratricopeptide (TPR) repeat protein
MVGRALLLLLFLTVLRPLAEWAGPSVAAIDCTGRGGDLARLEACLQQQRGDLELMAEIADRYERAGRSDEAERLYRTAVATDSIDADLRLRLAALLLRKGDIEAARAEASAAAEIQPGRASPGDLLHRLATDRGTARTSRP